MENHTIFFMGKSTISMAIFNSKLLNYQRVLPLAFCHIWRDQNGPNDSMRTPIPWSTGRRTGPKAELLRRLGVTTGAWELLRGWGMQLRLARNTSEESIHDSQCCNCPFLPMVFQHIMAVISGFIPHSRRPVWVASPCDSTRWFPRDVAVASGDPMPTACDGCPVVLGAEGVAEIRGVFRDGQFCLTYSHHSSAIFSPLHDDIS